MLKHRLAMTIAMAATVLIISLAYARIIEEFPRGGGYVVATKLLGEKAGLISGAALLVDYVLTITISIAAAGDAIFENPGQRGAGVHGARHEFGVLVADRSFHEGRRSMPRTAPARRLSNAPRCESCRRRRLPASRQSSGFAPAARRPVR